MTTEKVSKLDAAWRQLNTAIRMFFEGGDTISIHTLTTAAHEVLRGLSKPKGPGSIVKDEFVKYVKSEYQGIFRKKCNEAENFFKHADRDPHNMLEFRSEQTEFLLFDAIVMYKTLTGRLPKAGGVFWGWFVLSDPNILMDPTEKAKYYLLQLQGIDPQNKNFFLKALDLADQLPNAD